MASSQEDIVISDNVKPNTPPAEDTAAPEFKPTTRLYCIILGLGIANILAALENTVVAVAAPVILTDLDFGIDFIWVTNAFFLCSTAMQPLFGQFCNIFGRRWVMLSAIAIFALGSGICGGANSSGMLIAGRAVQGTGSGGIVLLSSVIISDLVPLRQRGSFSAMIMIAIGVGSSLGPFIGGAIVSTTSWRWVFYMNLPIAFAAFVWLFIFLRVKYNQEMTFVEKLKRIDVIGNSILIASTVSVLYALTYAGTKYAWSSWHTLVPLLLGFFGLGVFVCFQATSWSPEPLMPRRFFNNRTSLVVAISTFLSSALLYWALFFLPVYFQAVKLYSPKRSGVAMLPFSLLGIPGAIIGALVLVRFGRYKPVHIAAFAIQTIGLGLFTLQDQSTSVAKWAVFQCVVSLGSGMTFSTLLPAFQAFLQQQDLAACTAAWYFIRMFGHIWGVAIPSAIFNNRIGHLLSKGAVSDPLATQMLGGGRAFGSASAEFVEAFDPATRQEIRHVYAQGIQRVFQVAIIFSGIAFLLSFIEKEIKLRKTVETDYGLEEKQSSKKEPV